MAVRPRRLELMEELWLKHSLEISITDIEKTASKLRLIEICFDEEDEKLIDWLEYKSEILEEAEIEFNRQKHECHDCVYEEY